MDRKVKIDWPGVLTSVLLLSACCALSLMFLALIGLFARMAWFAIELGWGAI